MASPDEALATLPIFRDLSKHDPNRIRRLMTPITFPAGHHVIVEGSNGMGASILLGGEPPTETGPPAWSGPDLPGATVGAAGHTGTVSTDTSSQAVTMLESLEPGQPIVFGGNRLTTVPDGLAEAFRSGDRLIVVNDTGDLLHIPADVWDVATGAVARAWRAFASIGSVDDAAISEFFDQFAANLADDDRFAAIAEANRADVESARDRGRSTTRLELSDPMRREMVEGLRLWRDMPAQRDTVVESIDHPGWRLEQRTAGLGVVGFVFEGRPNVFADACGVVRGGNTVVFRIGSDALGTARAIVELALDPALASAGLPEGTASLVDSPARAAGWAMFSDPRLSLAVARGSGAAVAQLGAVARQAGIAVSLHGTGGAWIVTGQACDPDRLQSVVAASLDRKVCNTVNTVCVLAHRADLLMPRVLAGLAAAAVARHAEPKLHATPRARPLIPSLWFDEKVPIARAGGDRLEPRADVIDDGSLGHEWEWEDSPELTVAVVDSVEEAVDAFNRQAPRFVASLISDDEVEQDRFWAAVDAPFVGDGFTRWVDGQYALNRPELGLSNWQHGRLFGRGGVLSGDSVFTVRTRAWQTDPGVHR